MTAKGRLAKPAKRIRAAPAAAEPTGRLLCSRVRELRRKRGWTLEQMSAACGVSRSMISEIERGGVNPTLAVACRIAQAFAMSLGELVDLPSVTQRIDVIRADDRTYHFRSDRYCRIRTLSPLHLEKSVEFYEIVLRPGGVLRSAPALRGRPRVAHGAAGPRPRRFRRRHHGTEHRRLRPLPGGRATRH